MVELRFSYRELHKTIHALYWQETIPKRGPGDWLKRTDRLLNQSGMAAIHIRIGLSPLAGSCNLTARIVSNTSQTHPIRADPILIAAGGQSDTYWVCAVPSWKVS